MALMRVQVRSPRAPEANHRPGPGLPPDDAVLLDAPGAELGRALVAAASGDHRSAAGALAAARAAGQADRRDLMVRRLALFAHVRPEWFRRWREESPDDPGMLLVDAQRSLDHGWASPDRRALLHGTRPLIEKAARADPADPLPWRLALDLERGSRVRPSAFEPVWEQALRRAPHDYGCHLSALRYLTGARHASPRECLDFAERAAQDAGAGSMLQALPVHVAYTCVRTSTQGQALPGPELPRLHAAADIARALSGSLPPADPWAAGLRNLLVLVLTRLRRHDEALEQLRLTGPYATSFPWNRFDPDPLAHFLHVREAVLARTEEAAPRRRGRR